MPQSVRNAKLVAVSFLLLTLGTHGHRIEPVNHTECVNFSEWLSHAEGHLHLYLFARGAAETHDYLKELKPRLSRFAAMCRRFSDLTLKIEDNIDRVATFEFELNSRYFFYSVQWGNHLPPFFFCMLRKLIFPVYKPVGPTSHDVIQHIRKYAGISRIGHAGTLDPLAEGVLVVGIGREATKELSTIVSKEKEYLAAIKLGESSTTDDEEGQKTTCEIATPPSEDEIRQILPLFIGNIEQIPPIYSAIKIGGVPAYKNARKNIPMKLSPRPVVIHNIALIAYKWPILELRITSGAGVYIRALARDIGGKIGSCGYLRHLIRTRVGEFTAEKAVRMNDIEHFLVDNASANEY